MNKISNRLQLCAKDIMIICGKSERSARRLMQAIKAKFAIPPRLPISIDQFCEYTGIREERIRTFLQ